MNFRKTKAGLISGMACNMIGIMNNSLCDEKFLIVLPKRNSMEMLSSKEKANAFMEILEFTSDSDDVISNYTMSLRNGQYMMNRNFMKPSDLVAKLIPMPNNAPLIGPPGKNKLPRSPPP